MRGDAVVMQGMRAATRCCWAAETAAASGSGVLADDGGDGCTVDRPRKTAVPAPAP
jgi:hypothetical protein